MTGTLLLHHAVFEEHLSMVGDQKHRRFVA